MNRREVATDAAPKAIGPYIQAAAFGDLVFCSGQIALDPVTGELVGSGDIAAECEQVLANLDGVLLAAGCNRSSVLKTTIFITDMADFAAVNEIYGEFFGDTPPARSTVAVKDLPRHALVEIEAIAALARD